MEINELMYHLRGLATAVVMIAFFGICWWVYIYRSKDHFKEAEQLPFLDSDQAIGAEDERTQPQANNEGVQK